MDFSVNNLTFEVSSEEKRTVALCAASSSGIFGKLTAYHEQTSNIISKEAILKIPSKVKYKDTVYTVVGIKEDVFRNLDMLQELYLPKTLESFEWCLWGCNNLINFIVDENNKKFVSIEGVLFEKKYGIPFKLVAFPLGRYGKYKLPESVKHIESKAFKCCKIDELELSEGIETIGNNVFYRCYRLKEVVVPNSLKRIGKCQDDTPVVFRYKNRSYRFNEIYAAVSSINKNLKS